MEIEDLKIAVDNFGGLMKNRLIDNSWKGGWGECNVIRLYVGLLHNAANLANAIEWDDVVSVRRDAADIANYAMMIVDKLESEEESP